MSLGVFLWQAAAFLLSEFVCALGEATNLRPETPSPRLYGEAPKIGSDLGLRV